MVFPSALTVSIAVLPAFGMLMFGLRRYVAWTSLRAMNLVTRDAALVYVAVLLLSVGLVAQIGALPAAALVADRASPGLAAVGFALALPCAFAPYWLELALSALLHGRHKLPVTGLDGARDSVAEASTDRRRFALVAVLTAVAEEVLFRGAVLHEVTTHRGALLGVIAASLVFGLHHVSFGLPAIAGKTLAGVLWAGLMLLTGLIAVPLVAHLLFQSLVYRRMVRTRP